MRRKDREVTDFSKIIEILDKAKIIHIAFNTEDYPYILPIHYGYEIEDKNIIFYMHGALSGRKVNLLKESSKVGFEIDCDVTDISGGDVACKYSSTYSSIVGYGEMYIVDNIEEKLHGLNVLMKTQTGRYFEITEQMSKAVNVFKLESVAYTGKCREKN